MFEILLKVVYSVRNRWFSCPNINMRPTPRSRVLL